MCNRVSSSFVRVVVGVVVFALVVNIASAKKKCPNYVVKVFSAVGHSYKDLKPTVHAFLSYYGHQHNFNYPANEDGYGYRSINWDSHDIPYEIPFDYYNDDDHRGLILESKNDDYRVSNTYFKKNYDDRFSSILPKFISKTFSFYSANRLFSPYADNRLIVRFEIPGREREAYVSGFGAIFVDVDFKKDTYARYFDRKGCLITELKVASKKQGLSFSGLLVYDRYGKKLIPVIEKIQIKLGTLSLKEVNKFYENYIKGKDEDRLIGDVVVMDDFIYGEPIKPKLNPYVNGFYGYLDGKLEGIFSEGHGDGNGYSKNGGYEYKTRVGGREENDYQRRKKGNYSYGNR